MTSAALLKKVASIYHQMPPVSVYYGQSYISHEPILSAKGSASTVLAVESRVGLFGELVIHHYLFEPALPEQIRHAPLEFLELLATNLKVQNLNKSRDLWVYRLTFFQPDRLPVEYKPGLAVWERMVHGLQPIDTIGFNLKAPPGYHTTEVEPMGPSYSASCGEKTS